MAYQSQSSRNIFAPNSTRISPFFTKRPIHPQPKRPLPPDKTIPPSPKKKVQTPQLNFSPKSPPIPSRDNRPTSPRKIPLSRPLSARRYNNQPPSYSLPTDKPIIYTSKSYKTASGNNYNNKGNFRSQVYFVDPLTANLEKNHNQFSFGYASSSRNIFSMQNNNNGSIPPHINTTINKQTFNTNGKHIKKSQSHSPIHSNGFQSSSPVIHRATKSAQINTLNKKKKNKKLPQRKLFNDTNFIESDLKVDENGDQIHWVRGELIGTGAFGKVYKGYDKKTGKACAIKQIPFDPCINKNINNKKHLIDKEAEIMRQLKHKNIVEFYGYQTSIKYKTLIILMEYINGITIEQYYHKNGCFNEHLISKYVQQIMCGLQFAHKMNIIHRDIKGKNILISKEGIIKLADFGSAKLSDATLSDMALQPSMDFSTTALWTAPEVLHNNGYNHKIDIWSVGCVIIEMATAKQPWSECKFDNPFAALYHIGQSDNMPKYPSTLSKLCKDFIKLCLERDANKRCSASELLRHEFLDQHKH